MTSGPMPSAGMEAMRYWRMGDILDLPWTYPAGRALATSRVTREQQGIPVIARSKATRQSRSSCPNWTGIASLRSQ